MPKIPHLKDPDLDKLSRFISYPISGPLYRHRFQMVLDLCITPVERILEIGYGAGLLSYNLAPQAQQYVAVDIHRESEEVQRALREQGILNVKCKIGDARALEEIPNEVFDLVVSVSCLEHVREVEAVQEEVCRVLKVGGHAVYGMPVKNLITKTLFRIVGYDDSVIHPSTPLDVITAAQIAGLNRERERFLPRWAGHKFGLY
jgi:SAM-dependent methyltransferase